MASSVDKHVLALVTRNPNLLVPQFLVHSFLYYEMDSPIVSDAVFDELGKRLERLWGGIKHRHKGLLDKNLLKSGFYLQYPSIVPGAARSMLAEWL